MICLLDSSPGEYWVPMDGWGAFLIEIDLFVGVVLWIEDYQDTLRHVAWPDEIGLNLFGDNWIEYQ